ncbi:MAG TPA: CRISPR-associated helicase Cas3' [Cyanobacteria bacterium UBA8803]|nr:CRISPR-associated helicase Cas3' [Cyanobacteria bacterium UBA9273]HBL58314.1 CRISPR-associated helicase Cas3' [Cyanobacteria bacterium UBA8803]
MEIVRVEDADLPEIEGNRCRTFRAISEPLTVAVILNDIEQYQRQRVIIICNTVSQAQGLFRDLEDLNQDGELTITLLHSRFLPEDRAKKEAYLKETFAQNWQRHQDSTCHVLISTQVIEAGLNITCEVMHTHLCPMNSLLQRAGRCARFQGEWGEVYVYRSFQVNPANGQLAETDLEEAPEALRQKKQNFLPYTNEICELTWTVLQEHTASERVDKNVGFRIEEQWINQVHTPETLLQQERRANNQMNFEQQFNAAYFRGDESTANELIRFVDARSVFVWEEPIFLDEEPIDPKQLLAFSVPISTLCKVWQDVKNLGYEIDWLFKRIEHPKGRATETYSQPVCIPVTSRESLVTSVRILVNPRYVYYDDQIGLLIGPDVLSNRFSSPNKPKRQLQSEYCYRMDTYVGHLVLMWKCWREVFPTTLTRNGCLVETHISSVRDELLQAGGRFIQTKIFPDAAENEAEALFESLVFFAVLAHDLGKLQVKWQEVMRGWQAIAYFSFNGKNPRSHLLAHTDYDPLDKAQRDRLKAYEKKHKRPNHAVESAFLAREILITSLLPLLRDRFNADSEQIKCILHTVMMAAGRHHSAWAAGWKIADVAKVGKIQLHPGAKNAIASSWRSMVRFLPETLPLPPANLSRDVYPVINEFDLNRFDTDQIEYLQLYSLVVRALRLCDQRSVQLPPTRRTLI